MFGVELLLVVIAAIAVSSVAAQRGLQAPLVLVTVGALVSFVPGLPRLEIPPEVILSVVLPPLLYSTAVEFSLINFLRNLRPILGLGIGLVLVTAFAVGGVTGWLVPGITLSVGLVLGAVVAPPDAVTAAAIGRRLGLPKRVMTILTGESLVNDAAALTMFTITLTAVTGGHAFIENPVLFFGWTVLVGLAVGVLLAVITLQIRRRLDNPGLETVLSLVLPFAAYLAAEEAHASGVIAVVTAAFVMGHRSDRAGFAARLQERYVWRSLDVLLEAFVFAYMGLQLKFVIADVVAGGSRLSTVLLSALLILVVVIAVRPVWVLGNHLRLVLALRLHRWHLARDARARAATARARQRARDRGRRRPEPRVLPLKHSLVISWTGMRGVVTLAAAAGIPVLTETGGRVDGRADLQVIAFVVAVGTLLLQGTTLPLLIRRLRLDSSAEDEEERRQTAHAEEVAREAARAIMKDSFRTHTEGVDPALVARFADGWRQAQQARQRLRAQTEEVEDVRDPETAARIAGTFGKVRLDMVGAQRRALTEERDAGRLDDDLYRSLLEQLDYDEAATATRTVSRLS